MTPDVFQKNVQAVITWGWEDREFYTKWLGDDDPHIINDLIGPALNLASSQSNLAPALLDLFRKVLLQDSAYVERVKQHYAMFRQEVDGNTKKVVLKKKRRKQKRKKRKA
ncbi:MAG: hypothetical protein JRF30_05520 [Deltaproteobacteria bacterium]|nr:hypothetical protein [Deltaproteobacteria bacterium]MBW1795919.1 hypothetical protein [Deltaproteobacteria bacterium]MBW2330382.1 hypothetical protein [Deltaproteobacteria bacterium]